MSRTNWGLWVLLIALSNAAVLPALAIEDKTENGEGGAEVTDDREASFLPPPPALLKVKEAETGPVDKADLTVPPPFKPEPKAPPASAPQPVAKTSQPTPQKVGSDVIVSAPVAPLPVSPKPAAPAPSQIPAEPSVIVPPQPPVSASPTTPAPVAPVVLGESVAKAPLSDVDPETLGLLSAENGGLGTSIWKGTDRIVIDRFLPAIGLPTSSPALNDLARRLFLSTAATPASAAGNEKGRRSLLAQRIEALVSLGSVKEAWRLASLADPKLVDEVTLRLLTEAALIGPESKEVCDKVPSLIAAHAKEAGEAGAEWQKSLLVCQMRGEDQKAVQLGVDLMREQKAKDDIFISLVTKNFIGGSDKLPRQLTPLRPLTLAVLRQLALPLPPELYARADGSMVPELLMAKARDEKARILLAEKSAAQGIITASQLAAVYKDVTFKPEEIEAAHGKNETGPLSRAMAFQALQNEQSNQKKIDIIQKVVSDTSPSALAGSQGQLIASFLDAIPVVSDYNAFAVPVARYFAMAGKPDKALIWYNLAKAAAANSPDIKGRLVEVWPLFVLSGIVPDGSYAQGLKDWMDAVLAAKSEQEDGTALHERRERCGKVLLLLSASGFAVGEESWLRVIEPVLPSKQNVPASILTDRLAQATQAGRKGEVVLLSLLLTGGNAGEASFDVLLSVVRALRQVGLTAETQALAREVLMQVGGV